MFFKNNPSRKYILMFIVIHIFVMIDLRGISLFLNILMKKLQYLRNFIEFVRRILMILEQIKHTFN